VTPGRRAGHRSATRSFEQSPPRRSDPPLTLIRRQAEADAVPPEWSEPSANAVLAPSAVRAPDTVSYLVLLVDGHFSGYNMTAGRGFETVPCTRSLSEPQRYASSAGSFRVRSSRHRMIHFGPGRRSDSVRSAKAARTLNSAVPPRCHSFHCVTPGTCRSEWQLLLLCR